MSSWLLLLHCRSTSQWYKLSSACLSWNRWATQKSETLVVTLHGNQREKKGIFTHAHYGCHCRTAFPMCFGKNLQIIHETVKSSDTMHNVPTSKAIRAIKLFNSLFIWETNKDRSYIMQTNWGFSFKGKKLDCGSCSLLSVKSILRGILIFHSASVQQMNEISYSHLYLC